MNSIKEISLAKALEASGCLELPKAFTENDVDFWMKAVALVRKRNGSQSYCLVEHAPDGKVLYKQDFGEISPIYSLLSVHPYLVLDKTKYGFFAPDESFRHRAPLVGVSMEEYDAMSREEKIVVRYKVCMEAQLTTDAIDQEVAKFQEDLAVDENGIIDTFSDQKTDEENIYGAKIDNSMNTLIAEDGTTEEFVDVVGAKKRGRKKSTAKN